MSTDNKSLKQIMGFRLEKLNKLRELGVDPFPHKFSPINDSFDIINNYEKFENQNVVIAGRVMNIRKMGKASFAHLMDNKGQIQLFIKEDIIGKDKYDVFKLIDIGDFIGIEGHVFKTKLGEISIRIKNLDILSKSIRPLPVVKEKDGEVFDAFSDKELRYRNRHIDLIVNPESRDTFLKRTKIISNIRKTLDSNNFLEVETPVLQPIYGGANAKPFTTHHNSLNQKLYLRIADELYLKRLIIGGFDKVYEIAKNFRNEGMDRSHNPEFTMLEFYWAYADYRDCMILVETLIRNAAIEIGSLQVRWGENDIDLSNGFEELTFYGSLKDATGYDVSNMNRTELLNCSGFTINCWAMLSIYTSSKLMSEDSFRQFCISSQKIPSVFFSMFRFVIATNFLRLCFLAHSIADNVNLLQLFLVIWRIAIAASSDT